MSKRNQLKSIRIDFFIDPEKEEEIYAWAEAHTFPYPSLARQLVMVGLKMLEFGSKGYVLFLEKDNQREPFPLQEFFSIHGNFIRENTKNFSLLPLLESLFSKPRNKSSHFAKTNSVCLDIQNPEKFSGFSFSSKTCF